MTTRNVCPIGVLFQRLRILAKGLWRALAGQRILPISDECGQVVVGFDTHRWLFDQADFVYR